MNNLYRVFVKNVLKASPFVLNSGRTKESTVLRYLSDVGSTATNTTPNRNSRSFIFSSDLSIFPDHNTKRYNIPVETCANAEGKRTESNFSIYYKCNFATGDGIRSKVVVVNISFSYVENVRGDRNCDVTGEFVCNFERQCGIKKTMLKK